MRRHYTLSSGEKLYTWVNDLGYFTIFEDKTGVKEKCVLEFDHRSDDPTVEFNGEVIHIEDFDFTPFDELLEKVNKGIEAEDRWAVMSDEALATLMRDTERFGFVMEVNCFDTIIPGMGIGLKSDQNKVEALMIPFERQWKKKDWHYKVELMAEDESIRPMVGRETLYFSDLWSSVMSGKWIRLVDRKKWREEHPEDKVISNKGVHVFRF